MPEARTQTERKEVTVELVSGGASWEDRRPRQKGRRELGEVEA